MPSTYLSLHYHIVFGTKDRDPIIECAWRSRLHEYLEEPSVGSAVSPKRWAESPITSTCSPA